MIKLMKMMYRMLIVGIPLVVLQACYPGDVIPLTDLDTTSTFYNKEDLATAPTSAAIVWDVVQIENGDDDDIPYDGEVDDEILNTTLAELVDLYGADSVVIIWKDSVNTDPIPAPSISGVTVIIPQSGTTPPDVDVVITPSIILRNQYVGIVYPGYPWWGGGWWGGWYPGYPGWGPCYYCGYPPTISYRKYEVGSVVLNMYDLRQIPVGGTPPEDFDPSWVAIMRGLLSSDAAFNADRVTVGIEQAFNQSPYLN